MGAGSDPCVCVGTVRSLWMRWRRRPHRAVGRFRARRRSQGVGDGMRCHELQAVPAAFSDHLALSVELEVPESALRR